jgi:methylmalonyl-CoA/ethylmalonyl-CoA epimerase
MLNKFKLHHYGFATKSIKNSLIEFSKLGYVPIGKEIRDNLQGVDLLFIKNDSQHLIELVAPIEETFGPVSGILKKNGPTLYHICYEVYDLEKELKDLIAKRFVVLMKPTPAIAFNNRHISFLYNAQVGLIELLQK